MLFWISFVATLTSDLVQEVVCQGYTIKYFTNFGHLKINLSRCIWQSLPSGKAVIAGAFWFWILRFFCCRVLLHLDGLRVCCSLLAPCLQCTQHLLVTNLVMLATSFTAVCGICHGLLRCLGCCTAASIITQVWHRSHSTTEYCYLVYNFCHLFCLPTGHCNQYTYCSTCWMWRIVLERVSGMKWHKVPALVMQV